MLKLARLLADIDAEGLKTLRSEDRHPTTIELAFAMNVPPYELVSVELIIVTVVVTACEQFPAAISDIDLYHQIISLRNHTSQKQKTHTQDNKSQSSNLHSRSTP